MLASVGAKPWNTDEPPWAMPELSAVLWYPLIQDALSPATTSYDSFRNAMPTATFTGAGMPRSMDFEALNTALNSPRRSAPASKRVWFGMRGSSAVPRMPSGPGAVGVERLGPSDELSVLRSLKSKLL